MSQSIRQINLFNAEDWQKIYRAFTQINFSSYDFNTIRTSMVSYIRTNYPEDFNDFINSSEFISLIDLLAYTGQLLAFRMDLDSRENYLDTAERRESILKLAKMLSYKPRRNLTSRGLLKIVAISTNDDITDNNGRNLNNATIRWNDSNNSDWFEQFTIILNNSLIKSNQFGYPIQSGTFNNIRTQIYRFNNFPLNVASFNFNSVVDSLNLNFDICNMNFTEEFGFEEKTPILNNLFDFAYRNDGNGNSSTNTGFFLLFKQGTLLYEDYNITDPLPNRNLPINASNINESDVWLQTLDSFGNTLENWTKVPSLFSTNVIFNNLSRNIRNLYSVTTRDNDQITLNFGDDQFSNIPVGLFRVWYRTSANQNYTIKPRDIQNINLRIPYNNKNNIRKDLLVTLSLQEDVFNSAISETTEEVRRNAPQVYYTQDRMVNGEDYNVFPLQNSEALKLKAVNRTYSGHSRYIDINDPTGAYQNVNMFSDDGALYKDYAKILKQIPLSSGISIDEIIINYIQPILKDNEFINYSYESIRKNVLLNNSYNISKFYNESGIRLIWDQSSNSLFSSTGRIVIDNGTLVYPPVSINSPTLFVEQFNPAITPADLIREGSILKFKKAGWVGVFNITDNGDGFDINGEGKIRLAEGVQEGDELLDVIPSLRNTLTNIEVNDIKRKISNNRTFGIYFDYLTNSWKTIEPPLGESFDKISEFDLNDPLKSWLILIEQSTTGERFWNITARGLKYIFESTQNIRFFYTDQYKTFDLETGKQNIDNIKILKNNTTPEYEKQYNKAVDWIPYKQFEKVEKVFSSNDFFVNENRNLFDLFKILIFNKSLFYDLTPSSNPLIGDVYFDTSLNVFNYYNQGWLKIDEAVTQFIIDYSTPISGNVNTLWFDLTPSEQRFKTFDSVSATWVPLNYNYDTIIAENLKFKIEWVNFTNDDGILISNTNTLTVLQNLNNLIEVEGNYNNIVSWITSLIFKPYKPLIANFEITITESNSNNLLMFEEFNVNVINKPLCINDLNRLSYDIGSYVIYEDTLYKCVKSHTSKDFFEEDSDKWMAITPSLKQEYILNFNKNFVYEDGYVEPKRAIMKLADDDFDGISDNPETFNELVFGNNIFENEIPNDYYIFQQRFYTFDGYLNYKIIDNVLTFDSFYIEDAIDLMNKHYLEFETRVNWNDNTVAYCRGRDNNGIIKEIYIKFDSENVYQSTSEMLGDPQKINTKLGINIFYPSTYLSYLKVGDAKIPSQQTIGDDDEFRKYIGRKNLKFQWQHFASKDQTIDPAITNIIDIYVLLLDYDTRIRNWIANGLKDTDKPTPLTSSEIRNSFIDIEKNKSFSDQIIWHPVKYKFILGSNTDDELKSKIKIVKTKNSLLSDGEIKSIVINLINNYFGVQNWTFGETFYFTELAAYIHRELATNIASIHLVPLSENSKYGNLQEIKSESDEIFISVATINDIEIVNTLTEQVLRTGS